MSVTQCSAIVGVFTDRSEADRAIDDLVKAGFRSDQIGVVTRDSQVMTVTNSGEDGAAGVVGAVAGAGVGGLLGLGVVAGIIPVIGPAIAAGTLATILTNAAGGAAIAGLAGTLIGWGIPEQHAKYYHNQLHAGRVVVTVHAEDRCDIARTILESQGGYNHESVAISSAGL